MNILNNTMEEFINKSNDKYKIDESNIFPILKLIELKLDLSININLYNPRLIIFISRVLTYLIQNKNNNNNNKINNISNKIYKEDDKSENFFNYDNKNEFVTKEKMKNMLDEQKLYYENKMNIMQGEIDDLKKKVNDLSQIIENIGKCFIKPISKGSK
jgi:hypothetical protein